jgi:hypothetical protein
MREQPIYGCGQRCTSSGNDSRPPEPTPSTPTPARRPQSGGGNNNNTNNDNRSHGLLLQRKATAGNAGSREI